MNNSPVMRCDWVNNSEIYTYYHDTEWGKPEFDSQKLFEKLCLEGQQAGLSWITVLKKRENYRQAFFNFNPHKIAQMQATDIDTLMENSIRNAQAYIAMEANGEDFDQFIWSFVGGKPQINDVPTLASVPAKTATSLAISKALKTKGFVFIGETTCYAFMQSMGLVDDHLNTCWCKFK